MKFLIGLTLFFVLLSGFSQSLLAQEIPDPVRVKVVSDVNQIAPGQSFNLGVLFDIDPGWHIYWKNPGKTGLPTKIEFNLPSGFKSNPLNWPVPRDFEKPDGGFDHGYEGSVLLWSEINVPADAGINRDEVITIKVSWLSCKEICIPGKASFNYKFKTGDMIKSGDVELFDTWHNKLPQE